MFDQVYELQKIVSNRKEEYHSYKEYLLQGPFQWPDKWRLFFVGRVIFFNIPRIFVFFYLHCVSYLFVDYIWTAICKPVIMKILAVISVIMSAAVVWSEALFFKESPVLSVFALLITAAKRSYNYAFIEVRTIAIIYLFEY